ncbi:MAG: hypothetical protein IKN96_00565 [Oscillibacter sp.]|nr:hypothetical protein [Oscillibacter sp.]
MAVVKLPKARETRSYRFPALNGGLNLRDAEINLKDNESPEMENMWFDDGVLQSRPGQQAATSGWGGGSYSGYQFAARDIVYAATDFEEGIVAHIGTSLYTWHGRFSELRRVDGPSAVVTGVPRNAGTFFRFGADYYYKNAGGFFKLAYNARHSTLASPFTVSDMTAGAFVPTTVMNADPATGSGDLYQPENRLSPQKRITYNPSCSPSKAQRTGNGLQRAFVVGVTAAQNLRGISSVYVNGNYVEPALYDFDAPTGTVVFDAAPPENAAITFNLDIGDTEYHLPAEGIQAVTEVRLWSGGSVLTLTGGDYAVDLAAGIVTFAEAPPVSDPPADNTVEITYSKANPDALSALMKCPYAAVCGSGRDLCAVFGGGANQDNALFWSGSTQNGLDLSYWPIRQHNFADGAITGFGEQYGQTFVFQTRKIGKLGMSTESVNGRDEISLTYSGVNDNIGCDLPNSVRLVDNCLTFANKSGGVYRILSASPAYENNVQCVSEKINGSDARPGLLYDMRVAGSAPVCSLDDGKRYWLCVNGHAWLWDYSLSGADNPVWFYFTGLSPRALALRDGVPCLLSAPRVVRLSGQVFDDLGEPIRKVYQFPVRNFGGYDRLKDVRTVIVSARADAPSDTEIIYETDYESRQDRANLAAAGYDRLSERDLEVRDLSVPRHAATFRRAPNCKHVRHFSMRLENNEAGKDLSVFSAEIQYRFVGRDK